MLQTAISCGRMSPLMQPGDCGGSRIGMQPSTMRRILLQLGRRKLQTQLGDCGGFTCRDTTAWRRNVDQ